MKEIDFSMLKVQCVGPRIVVLEGTIGVKYAMTHKNFNKAVNDSRVVCLIDEHETTSGSLSGLVKIYIPTF